MMIADTGFWVALLNRHDDLHRQAKACVAQIHEPLITTLPVMTEPARVPARRWLDINSLIGRRRFRRFTGDEQTERNRARAAVTCP